MTFGVAKMEASKVPAMSQPDTIDKGFPSPNHLYLSTACTHGFHMRCRGTCKFCEAACRCQCHVDLAIEIRG